MNATRRSSLRKSETQRDRSGWLLGSHCWVVLVSAVICLHPTGASAHDAFGDLGPFYASLLHPIADPLQAALLVGTAAFLGGRPLCLARSALPVFIVSATLSACVLASGVSLGFTPIMTACAAMLAGLAAILPRLSIPRAVALIFVAITGFLTGLAPGAAAVGDGLQTFFGTIVGIAVWATLSWFGLETAGRRLTPLVSQIVGSWVAAIGILVMAFAL